MPSLQGRLLLIKHGDGASPEVFTTIAGLRDTSLTVNETAVDVTSKDDSGIRQLLVTGNVLRSMTVTGTGVFTDVAIMNTIRDAVIAGTNENYQVVIPGTSIAGGTYEGGFRITSFEESGAHDGEVQYSITLESTNATTFTDAT